MFLKSLIVLTALVLSTLNINGQSIINISDKKIVKVKIIECSLETTWWKWTSHEGLLTFFGKDNKIELTPGGAFEIYFFPDNSYGLKGSEGCKVLSYLPKEMLSFTWNAPPQFEEVRNSDYHTWVVVNFKSVSSNQTEVKITHLGWPDDEKWFEVFDYFDKAWDSVLNYLYQSVKK